MPPPGECYAMTLLLDIMIWRSQHRAMYAMTLAELPEDPRTAVALYNHHERANGCNLVFAVLQPLCHRYRVFKTDYFLLHTGVPVSLYRLTLTEGRGSQPTSD